MLTLRKQTRLVVVLCYEVNEALFVPELEICDAWDVVRVALM